MKSTKRWQTQGRDARGARGSEGDGGGARAQRPGHGGACEKSSTEPYRRQARHMVARSEKRRRWRSVACKISGGDGSPASERGGGDGVKEWRAG
jgi:hypothetical protein